MLRKIAIIAASALTLSGSRRGIAAEGGSMSRMWPSPSKARSARSTSTSLQRGLQVFTEVCSACHGMKFVPIRSLSDEGGPHLPEDQVRAYASQFSGGRQGNGRGTRGDAEPTSSRNPGRDAPDLR